MYKFYPITMKVILAESAGFCWGVNRAVAKARELAQSSPHPIFTDGPLIHNDQMMKKLQDEGIKETRDPLKEVTEKNSTLLIRAHGISPERRDSLKKLPGTLTDTTCPDVARTQGLIRKYARKGFNIIIFGDSGHAEVEGLLGFCENRGHVVSKPEDVKHLPDMNPVCLVSQSTQFPVSYEKISETVKKKFPNCKVLETICKSTTNRQKELISIAGRVDAIVVVGGSHSANTMRLVELAARHKPTFHIQTADQLNLSELAPFQTIGLTAGASTPSFIIDEVKTALESI